jgi:hypothetical protein
MHDCKGDAEVTMRIRIIGLKAQFNSNYKGGIEVLEDEVCDTIIGLLPQEFGVEVLDVAITNYEHKCSEREVENED